MVEKILWSRPKRTLAMVVLVCISLLLALGINGLVKSTVEQRNNYLVCIIVFALIAYFVEDYLRILGKFLDKLTGNSAK
jgi:hypothetical protein